MNKFVIMVDLLSWIQQKHVYELTYQAISCIHAEKMCDWLYLTYAGQHTGR